MTEISFSSEDFGDGPGSYDMGVFHLPNGQVRGIEDVADLILPDASGAVPVARRGGIARGLRDALAASGPLPRPLGLAASVVGFGLDVLGADGRAALSSVELRFADGTTATIRVDGQCAAQIGRDREVVRMAALRQARSAPPRLPAESRTERRPTEEHHSEGPDARALASIFAYEKRGGRLRRLSAKAPDEA
jgi:hypothetical protein